jgi:quercetin dioxygenase-like cupin family protein
MKAPTTRTIAALAVVLASSIATAQAPGIKRTLMQRTDSGPNQETILGLAEIAAGGAAGRHTHFGIEVGYVVEGTSILEIEGEAPRTLKAGDSYLIPAGRIHDAKAGPSGAKVLATYVVEKGKPLATPAP